MSDREINSIANRAAAEAQRRYRARWIRIGLLEVTAIAVLVIIGVMLRPPARAHDTSGSAPGTSPSARSQTTTPTPSGGRQTSDGQSGASRVGERLQIVEIKPTAGHVGDKVELYGTGLDQITAVRFGSRPAKILADRDNSVITVIAPDFSSKPGAIVAIVVRSRHGWVLSPHAFRYLTTPSGETASPQSVTPSPLGPASPKEPAPPTVPVSPKVPAPLPAPS